jgi:predicted GIY-YIG superfamily endonuclease
MEKQKHKQSTTLPYWIVYLLPNYHYVGVTNNPTYRMYDHKSRYNRYTDNWIELEKFDNREDALRFESIKHGEGYAGIGGGRPVRYK